MCVCVCVCVCVRVGGGGNISDYYRRIWGHASSSPWYFRALRQLLVQSEAKFLIEQLNTCFIAHTDLVLWLTYCMKKKKSFLHLIRCKCVQKLELPPPPPAPTHTDH